MMYLRARNYYEKIGKFVSRDGWTGSTIEPMSYNLWLYAFDNPINKDDPSGLKPRDPCPGPYCQDIQFVRCPWFVIAEYEKQYEGLPEGDAVEKAYKKLATTPVLYDGYNTLTPWWKTDLGQGHRLYPVDELTLVTIFMFKELGSIKNYPTDLSVGTEVTSRLYWDKCPNGCSIHNSRMDDGLKQMLSWSSSFKDVGNGVNDLLTNYKGQYLWAYYSAENAIFSPEGSWKTGLSYTTPSDWFNPKTSTEDGQSKSERDYFSGHYKSLKDTSPDGVYYESGDHMWVVLTAQQHNNHCAPVTSYKCGN